MFGNLWNSSSRSPALSPRHFPSAHEPTRLRTLTHDGGLKVRILMYLRSEYVWSDGNFSFSAPTQQRSRWCLCLHCHGDATRFFVSRATAMRRWKHLPVTPSLWLCGFLFRFLSVISDSFLTTALVLWKVPYWTKFPFLEKIALHGELVSDLSRTESKSSLTIFLACSACVRKRHSWCRNQPFVTSHRALIGQRKHSCLRPPLPPSPHPPFRIRQSAPGQAALRNTDLWLTVNNLGYHKIAQLSICSDLLLISIAQQASVSHHPLHPEPVLTLCSRIKAPEPGMTPDGW